MDEQIDIREMTDSREVLEGREPTALRWFLTIIALMVVAVIIALFILDKDTSVTAQGIVQPSEAVVSITPMSGGKIDSLKVADGQKVQSGDVLFTLDTTYAQKQKELAQQGLAELEGDKKNYRMLEQSIEEGSNLFPDDSPFHEVYHEYELRRRSAKEQSASQLEAVNKAAARQESAAENIAQQQDQLNAKLLAYSALVKSVEANAPYSGTDAYLQTSYRAYEAKLEQSNLALSQARTTYSETEKAHQSGQATKKQLDAAKHALDSALLSQKDLTSSYLTELYGSINQMNQQVGSLSAQTAQSTATSTNAPEDAELSTTLSHLKSEELVKAEAQAKEIESNELKAKGQIAELENTLENSTVKATNDGTVMFQGELTVGTVLQAGSPVMSVIPDTGSFEIEFDIPEKDRSQVQEGDPLLCAINSLPYQEYGKLDGKVTSISATSLQDKQDVAYYRATGTLSTASVTKSGGAAGMVRPGMVARVDIISGSEKIGIWLLKELNFLD